jgi:glycosyltransferase involved in cell wall biosynthesis
MQLLMPRAISAADRIICVSQWTYNTLLSRYPSAAPKSVVIPNGFPALALGRGTLDNRNLLGRGACPSKSEPWRLSRHGEGSREGTAPRLVVTGASNPPIKLLYISRFEPYKHHTLLFSLLRASPALSLTLVTDPSGAQTLKTLAPDLLATHRLSITSSLLPAALTTLHKDTDIYISPSSLEGFSLPVADALAAGKPVVYQSGSGIDEVAGATVAWPVAPDAPVDAWLAAIASASAAASTPAFAAAAHAYVSSRPTWKDAAIALINLYGALK